MTVRAEAHIDQVIAVPTERASVTRLIAAENCAESPMTANDQVNRNGRAAAGVAPKRAEDTRQHVPLVVSNECGTFRSDLVAEPPEPDASESSTQTSQREGRHPMLTRLSAQHSGHC